MAALHQVLCPEKRREKTKAARLEAKGTVFQTDKSAQDSDTSCKFGGPQNHSHFLPVDYKFGGPHRLTQACSKVLYLQLQFFFFLIAKGCKSDINQNQPKEEIHWAESGTERVPNRKLALSSGIYYLPSINL